MNKEEFAQECLDIINDINNNDLILEDLSLFIERQLPVPKFCFGDNVLVKKNSKWVRAVYIETSLSRKNLFGVIIEGDLVVTYCQWCKHDDNLEKINLNGAEIQSGLNRVKAAEGLIQQLPATHDGRNTWLLNYGTRVGSWELRNNHYPCKLEWDEKTLSAKCGDR